MKDQIKKVPNLRFKGFTNDWEQRKLGEISKIVAGGDKDKNLLKQKGKYPVIANSVNTDGIIGYYNDKYRVMAPAITVTGRGDIGHATARFQNFTPVVRLLALTTTHDAIFLTNAINSIRIFNESTGVPQLTSPQLSNYYVSVTDLREETRVGNLLSIINNSITLQQRKLELLKEIKKGLLQKMFADKDSKQPVLRFADFHGDWVKRKLGEVTNIEDNKRKPVKASERIPGDIPYYGANGIQDHVKGYTHTGEHVLVAEDGANNISDYPIYFICSASWINNHSHVLTGKKSIVLNKFLAYDLKTVRYAKYLVGSGRYKLNAETLKIIPLKVPSLTEQKYVGRTMSKINGLVTLQQKRLVQLKFIKKSLLQQLFI